MKVKHINSGEVIDLSEPNYGKHYNSIYGLLTLSGYRVWFFYEMENELCLEELTNDYEILNPKEDETH